MATERPLESVSDADLYRSAIPEAVPEAEVAPPPEPVQQELPLEPQPQPPQAVPPPVEPPEAGVPSWRLREEAEARRMAEDRARALESRLQEIATHLQQRQQQEKPPDFFSNPDQATQALVARALQPFAQEYQRTVEEQRRERMYNSKMVATVVHGADKVDAAEQAFLDARAKETLDPADYERVVGSPNRYDAVVKWHKNQSVLSSVGDDPEAWFNKQLEARMSDPNFQAKMLEKVRGDAASRPSVTKLPPSLSKVTAAANNRGEIGDLSDSHLFAYATKK